MGRAETPGVITLVGAKHTGKSSAGKALARLIGDRFLDLDELIESRMGRSPRELYEEGPEVFRTAEAEAAEALAADLNGAAHDPMEKEKRPLVVAAGGGLVDNPRALAALQAAGCLVSLSVSAKTAWARVRASDERTGSLPPFLRGDDPEAIHRALHERRTAAYARIADFEIDAEELNPTDLAEEIASALSIKRTDSGRNRA